MINKNLGVGYGTPVSDPEPGTGTRYRSQEPKSELYYCSGSSQKAWLLAAPGPQGLGEGGDDEYQAKAEDMQIFLFMGWG
jgi:hypothetical protein